MPKIFPVILIFLPVAAHSLELGFSGDYLLGPKLEISHKSHALYFTSQIYYENSKPDRNDRIIENYQKTYAYGFLVAYAKRFELWVYKDLLVNFVPYIGYGYFYNKERKFKRLESGGLIRFEPIDVLRTVQYDYQKYSHNQARIGGQVEISLKNRISIYMILSDFGFASGNNKYGERILYAFEHPVEVENFLNLGMRVRFVEF